MCLVVCHQFNPRLPSHVRCASRGAWLGGFASAKLSCRRWVAVSSLDMHTIGDTSSWRRCTDSTSCRTSIASISSIDNHRLPSRFASHLFLLSMTLTDLSLGNCSLRSPHHHTPLTECVCRQHPLLPLLNEGGESWGTDYSRLGPAERSGKRAGLHLIARR